MARITVYDRWETHIGTLHGVLSAIHTDELNGEDSLTVETTDSLQKGYRLVWVDARGRAHEHIVASIGQETRDGKTVTTAVCENSLSETYGDYITDLRPLKASAAIALTKALSTTRWIVGLVDNLGSADATFYHTSAREAIQDTVETWGGELETEIVISGDEVSTRKVNLLAQRGADSGKRFTYTKDLISVIRTVDVGDVVSALYGYGKGEETDTGGYGRRLSFGSINGGKDYLEDATALAMWGRPNGSGRTHAYGSVVFEDCEDKAELLRLTRAEFERRKVPRVSYECDVIDLESAGMTHEGVDVGDTVYIIDKGFTPELRVQGRVAKIERDAITGEAQTVTVGNIIDDIASILAKQAADLKALGHRSSSWDVAASANSNYINQIINGLNLEFDSGASYIYQSPTQGIIVGSVPLNPETGKPTRTPAGAIQLKGGGFRIADAVKADGSFDWRTFGTGSGFTADEITAGVIQGGANHWNLETGDLLFKQGGITDTTGKNSWNLDTGEFSLSANADISGSQAGILVVSTDVQYGVSDDAAKQPTSWTTTALWAQGKHLWTRVKMTLANESVQYSTARRIANDKGMGASEVVEQYYLSTSSTAQTGGSWFSSQPAWVKGRYYWTRSRITWSDESVTYTDPVLARALTSGNQATDNLDDELTQREIFNRLTNDGQTQGIYLQNGLLYVNATYLKTGIISDAAGRNTWNLGNGTLNTNYMTANNVTANGTMSTGYDTSYKAKLTGGKLKFFYNSAETIELVSIPSYTSGAKGGYVQACNGSTYLGLRAPKLYTAENASEAGTTGFTGNIYYAGFYSRPGDDWDIYSLKAYTLSFKNGICIG